MMPRHATANCGHGHRHALTDPHGLCLQRVPSHWLILREIIA